jgi:DNA (cytosine-5)-methyltransferase 1
LREKSGIAIMSALNFVSLFSGCGGLDLGLIQAGYSPLASVEIDNFARSSHDNMLSSLGINGYISFDDINGFNPQDLLSQLELGAGDLDLLCGGPPCQAFSLIGKRDSVNDPRGMLLFKMAEFAEALLPKAILIEQVKGLLSAKGSDNESGGAFHQLMCKLHSLGYTSNHKVLRAADYGVPQLRDRLFIVSLLGGYKFEFPERTHAPFLEHNNSNLVDNKPGYITTREALKDLPSPVLKGDTPAINNHIDITPDGDRFRINGVPSGDYLARQLHLPEEQRKRLHPQKDTTKFRRLDWNKPSLTLRGGECFYHPDDNRYLTPRECLRLHGYPDSFELLGPIRGRSGQFKGLDQHRQVANSVPPPLAKILGEKIKIYIERLQLDNPSKASSQQAFHE